MVQARARKDHALRHDMFCKLRSPDLPNNDIGKRTQSTSRERRADLDEAIAPGLDVQEGFLDLFGSEGFILETRLVGSDPFDHLAFVVFGEALGAHLCFESKV